MKKYQAFIILLLLAINVTAQVTDGEKDLRKSEIDTTSGWQRSGTISINFSQASLTNWAAGGQNTIAINGIFGYDADYHTEKSSWNNSIELGYGTVRQGKSDASWIKTDDKVDLTSKYGHNIKKGLYYAGLANFRTQMTPGYNLPNDSVKISTFLAPGYFLGALGLEYKKDKFFSAFVAPLTSKITIVGNETLADSGAFGVDAAVLDTAGNVLTPGKNVRFELGGYVRLFFKKDIVKNVTLQTKADFFSNYLENPTWIDVNWETLITMKVNKYISATLSTHLIYDRDIQIAVDTDDDGIVDDKGPRVQFKEVLGIGLSYKF